jgi:NADH-quinone oxidoreductase subunit M
MNESLLSILVFSPLLGIIILAFMPKTNENQLKLVGFLATLLPLALSIIAYFRFLNGDALSEKFRWIGFGNAEIIQRQFTVFYELGVDGLSIVLILLTTIVSSLAAIASVHIKKEWKGYFMLFLLLELGILGVFASENLVLFFLFFELTLVPMFFLIGKWGYYDREKAAYSFLIYNGVGSAILLIVFAALFAKTGTVSIAELKEIMAMPAETLAAGGITPEFKLGIVIALLVAFGVKLPIFPLHSWMLKVHVQAPPAIVMIHSGILLKIGAYGLIRFGVGVFPQEFQSIAVLLAILGVINLLYGAFLALVQTDLKMVLAYSSISHMGIVLIGLGAMNDAGFQGAVFQVISHGLISALLFFLIGVLYERVGTSSIEMLGGIAKVMPLTAGFMLTGAMASLGLPGMSGFVSEFMAFLGLFREMPIVAAVGALGIILTAVYLLRAFLKVTFGTVAEKYENTVHDIKLVESIPVIVLLAFIIFIGVYPNVLANTLAQTLDTILMGIGG